HGRHGRPERRVTEIARTHTPEPCEHIECAGDGSLPLGRGHADGRVSLDMLDGGVALAQGQLEIRDRHIVQQVYPLAAGVAHGTDAGTAGEGLWGGPPRA